MKSYLARAQAYGELVARGFSASLRLKYWTILWLAHPNLYSLCGGRLDEDVTSIGIKYLFEYSKISIAFL